MYGSVWYDKRKSLIHWSEYDSNNKREYKSKKWAPDFYLVTNEESDYKSNDGLNLKRIQPKTWAKRRDAIKSKKDFNERIFGSDLSPENKFILETWPGDIEATVPEINYIFIDIECESENGFPDAETVPERVNLITVYNRVEKQFYTFGLEHDYVPTRKNCTYTKCETEEILLQKFCELLKIIRPDIISGWNSKGKTGGYDIPYLFNRILKICDGVDIALYKELQMARKNTRDKELKETYSIEISSIEQNFNWIKCLSPYGEVECKASKDKDRFTKQMVEITEYIIHGVTDYDYLEIYKQFEQGQKESYKLDNIAFAELGERKLDLGFSFKEAYKKENWKHFVDYNIQDVDLLVKLENKKGYLQQAICLSYKCHCIFKENFGTVTKQECAVYNILFNKRNVIMEDRGKGIIDQGTFEGAYVKEPIPGMYENVSDFDVKSLYPSLMMGMNISPDVKKFEILNCPDRLFRVEETEPDREVVIQYSKDDMEASTVSKVAKMVRDNNWPISSANVVFEDLNVQKGIITEILELWYAQRKEDKKHEAHYKKEAQKLAENGTVDRVTDADIEVDIVINDEPTVRYLTVSEHKQYKEYKRLAGIHYSKNWSCKILLNSLYGALSTPYFRFYDPSLSRSVTLSGQTVIKNNGEMLNNYFLAEIFNNKLVQKSFDINHDLIIPESLVYIDTDSLYMSFGKLLDKLNVPNDYKKRLKITRFLASLTLKVLDKYNEKFFVDTFNAKNTIFWDQELISDRAIFIKKKKYVCHIVEENGNPVDDLLVKGLEIVRSSTPKKCRDKIKEAVLLVLKGATNDELKEYSQNIFNDFMSWDINDISLPKSCNNMRNFMVEGQTLKFMKGAPQHMKGAIAYNYYLKHYNLADYEPIKEKDKFKLVLLKKGGKYVNISTMGYVNNIPKEFDLTKDDIDYMKHFQLAFVGPLENILDAIGWSLPDFNKKTDDIDDLFD